MSALYDPDMCTKLEKAVQVSGVWPIKFSDGTDPFLLCSYDAVGLDCWRSHVFSSYNSDT